MVNSSPARPVARVRLNSIAVLATNLVVCTVVAVLLWAFVPVIGRHGFLNVFVHAQAIGNAICLLSVASQSLLDRIGTRSLKLELALLPVIIAVGFFVGTFVARVALDLPGPIFDLTARQPQLAASLATAVVVTVIATWFFTTREQLANLELAAAEEAKQAEAARRLAGEAQLAMLRAQIEPHMLFNTLANLRTLIAQDPDRAREMLDRLVEFLRGTLTGACVTHTNLRTEFDLLETYLALMQMRFGARLAYSLDLPAEFEPVVVPALLLQPVVENAIRHGIEPASEGGNIVVTARRRDDLLVLAVQNTGVGWTPSMDKPIADADDPSRAGGFGLKNLRERLETLYGARGGVDIQSSTPCYDTELALSGGPPTSPGTAVTIFLPLAECPTDDRAQAHLLDAGAIAR